ncbi:hypothetical protein HanHA300_Chr08g0269191 [Helianthus annuus]|nr:hypothetical protein HanHA300_Chr08g0269191 [Helianthus annuus]KAJ0552506.1 hypothetical protein HanHA89_Chr08g0286011 [Helianthus annuus]KAJ0718204.1 hypothetical protein HanLR1_Chr08g0268061 [Helianthus annuus]KAJ0721437.1 hypothetical protein HanOQP8_Chr08g0275561 [Helianthus annuus]
MHSIDLGSIHKALNLTTHPLSEPFFLLKGPVLNDACVNQFKMMSEKIVWLNQERSFIQTGYHESVPEGLRLQRYKVKQWRWRFNFRKAGGSNFKTMGGSQGKELVYRLEGLYYKDKKFYYFYFFAGTIIVLSLMVHEVYGLQDFEEPKDARMHDKQSGNLLKKSRCLREQMMNYKMEVIWWNKEYDGDVRLYGSRVTKK